MCSLVMYKGTDKEKNHDGYEQKIEWLRQVLEWHEELEGHPHDENQNSIISKIEFTCLLLRDM